MNNTNKKLTIGLATYDEYDGTYFTIQAIRLFHPEVLDQINFTIVNNNPTSQMGKSIGMLAERLKAKHIPFDEYKSTAVRNLIFETAETPYVMCIDSHVLIVPGAIKKLINYFDNIDNGDLLHGPLCNDLHLQPSSTSFCDEWGACMWGRWHTDKEFTDADGEPFDIFAQGLGLFACKKDAWLGFNKKFRGFGGEEVYIHKKFRKAGKRTLCLPFLGWVHRFRVGYSPPYPLQLEQRFRNYVIGALELEEDDPVTFMQHFTPQLKEKRMLEIIDEEKTAKKK